MKKDQSYGVIPLRFHDGHWQLLIIQHHSGWWGFPKGHADFGETPLQAAERELFEETGLKVVSHFPLESLMESYSFFYYGSRIHKSVHYFLALVEGQILIQEEEIKACQWLPLEQAFINLTYKEGKNICQQTIDFLKSVTFDQPTKELQDKHDHR